MYIDSHAHIYLDEFKEDLELVIQNGRNNGVIKTYMPNIDTSTIPMVNDVE